MSESQFTFSFGSQGKLIRCVSGDEATRWPIPTHIPPESAMLDLPDPLAGAHKIESLGSEDILDVETLSALLKERGVSTERWGEEDTKAVGALFKEIRADESGLEVWNKSDGNTATVRVTHVLRAKVCSPQSHKRNIFLFNTWQQFGDGRTRIRNGLLSEKLMLTEVPLEDHLHEVCRRAVTEEEMHFVVDSAVRIGPGVEYPEYDPEYKCPLTVVDAKFIDHIIEIEFSKSYPGLLTMYHLYTVDVICNGLPAVDLNTLEFEHSAAKGQPKLKYIHAWVWLEWSEIQRYLFEGSELKELKQRGSFRNAAELRTWLGRFQGLDLEKWGQAVEELFQEVERQETYLELWGRHDGVPLLVRVAHVIQLKILSTDPRQSEKLLFCTWVQDSQGRARTENRLPTKKLNIAEMPFSDGYIADKAQEAAKERLSRIVDVNYKVRGGQLLTRDLFSKSDVAVVNATFIEHRSEVEESRSFKVLLQTHCI